MPIDSRQPTKALDVDTETRMLPPNHYRYGINGRSGTSDKDGVGAAEGIRGNALVAVGAEFEKEIGSCPDVKNNAVIRFIQNEHAPIDITTGDETVFAISPLLIVELPNLDSPLALGEFLLIQEVAAGPEFVGQIIDRTDAFYTLHFVSGDTPTLADIDSVSRVFYNYIKRYYASTGVDEFLINPVLMSDVLGWTSTSRIYNPRVIEAGFTQLLLWTDDLRPCMMDIDKMKQ